MSASFEMTPKGANSMPCISTFTVRKMSKNKSVCTQTNKYTLVPKYWTSDATTAGCLCPCTTKLTHFGTPHLKVALLIHLPDCLIHSNDQPYSYNKLVTLHNSEIFGTTHNSNAL